MVVDFERGEVNSYSHGGWGKGYGFGASGAVGIVENYENAQSYAGPFVDMGVVIMQE